MQTVFLYNDFDKFRKNFLQESFIGLVFVYILVIINTYRNKIDCIFSE